MAQQVTSHPFEWKILAIGGSSGTGKTIVAQEVAKRFGVSVLFVDDIRLDLQQMTTPREQPGLHVFSSNTHQPNATFAVSHRGAEAALQGQVFWQTT